MNLQGNKITWLGHATFRIETRDLITIYIDPWLSNPLCPEDEKRVKKCDVMICTHGHGDHIGDAVRIANELNPMVVGIFELCAWLQKKGAKQTSPMNKGGTQTVGGVKITMTHAVHSCGIEDDDGSMVYGGEACGYVLELPGGVRLYHAGDTAVFGDMQIIHQSVCPRDCHASHRRPLHHGPARSRSRLHAAAAEDGHPYALWYVSTADRPTRRTEKTAWPGWSRDPGDEAGTDAGQRIALVTAETGRTQTSSGEANC